MTHTEAARRALLFDVKWGPGLNSLRCAGESLRNCHTDEIVLLPTSCVVVWHGLGAHHVAGYSLSTAHSSLITAYLLLAGVYTYLPLTVLTQPTRTHY